MSDEINDEVVNYIHINGTTRRIQDLNATRNVEILSQEYRSLSDNVDTIDTKTTDLEQAIQAAEDINLLSKSEDNYTWNTEAFTSEQDNYIVIGTTSISNNQSTIAASIYKDGILNNNTVYYTIDIYDITGLRVDGTSQALPVTDSFSRTSSIKAGNLIIKVYEDINQTKILCGTELTIAQEAPIDGEDGEDAISVQITSSNGNIFNNYTSTDTILTCTVYSGTEDVTDKVTSFTWKNYDKDGNLLNVYDPSLHGRYLTVSTSNILIKSIFNCEVEIDL